MWFQEYRIIGSQKIKRKQKPQRYKCNTKAGFPLEDIYQLCEHELLFLHRAECWGQETKGRVEHTKGRSQRTTSSATGETEVSPGPFLVSNSFGKRPDNKCLMLCKTYSFCCNYSTLPLYQDNIHRWHINEEWVGSENTLCEIQVAGQIRSEGGNQPTPILK